MARISRLLERNLKYFNIMCTLNNSLNENDELLQKDVHHCEFFTGMK